MRDLITSAVLSLVVSAGAMLPAPAGASDAARERMSRAWSGGPRLGSEERRERQRFAYTWLGQRYDEEAARPRRQRRVAGRTGHRKAHYGKRRHARGWARHRRGRIIARRPGASRRAAINRARRPAAPVQTGKNLGVPRGSGQLGMASYYWQPQRLASGGWFNPNAMTAAHRKLPFGTRVRVTHQGSGRSVDVTINDRGPYIAGRIIDLSRAAAGVIGMTAQGIAKVTVEVLGR